MQIYFDATDIAHWAGHSDRVTGIQRVELNIVRSLARDHGGEAIRGIFFDRDSKGILRNSIPPVSRTQRSSVRKVC